MSELFEIAYAAATNRLCFFTGTGFSKAVTNNKAPSWKSLLEELCDQLPHSVNLKESLFQPDNKTLLSLEEIAQVISIKLASEGKSIHEETAKIIKRIKSEGDNESIEKFLSSRPCRIITTNYDKLAECLAKDNTCQSIAPGLPIPRSQSNVKTYHVHGSIDSPENMVITSEDYFKFINSDSYFSRKLSTILHENTVVILGYSLGDTNLKAIMSEYNGFSKTHSIGSNLFLISRSSVDQHVKDYYAYCYGIRVIDELDIHDFFDDLNEITPKVERIVDKSINSIIKVTQGKHKFREAYIKLEDSFYRIISASSANGMSLDNPCLVKILGDVIETKRKLTAESDAWEQYEHLARWLIHLGSILEISNTSIEKIYLNAVLHSMTSMSSNLTIGRSWHAYKAWKRKWPNIKSSNRTLIKTFIRDNTSNSDALTIVNLI